MKTYLRYALLTLLWGAAAAYVIWAASAARRVRRGTTVQQLRIEVVDSTSQGQLVSSAKVREWISQSGIRTIGTAVDAVDLTGIEQLVARNGFVEEVIAYVSYSGVLHLAISQRKPLVRLLTDGMNGYVTSQGYVFAAPKASSLYVPVVTGTYRPPFPASWVGDARTYTDNQLQAAEQRYAELEREKYPFYKRELQNDRNISDLRGMRIKRRWWRLESASQFDERVEKLRTHKAALRRRYRYEARLIREGIERISEQQQAVRVQQKKLEKSYEDFMKLLTFVEYVEKDDFWRSEVVQIVARTTPSGALEVDLTPRSGRHIIRFGRLEKVDEKFDKLLRFYRRGLSAVGWETYRTIDLRYSNQVVCKK